MPLKVCSRLAERFEGWKAKYQSGLCASTVVLKVSQTVQVCGHRWINKWMAWKFAIFAFKETIKKTFVKGFPKAIVILCHDLIISRLLSGLTAFHVISCISTPLRHLHTRLKYIFGRSRSDTIDKSGHKDLRAGWSLFWFLLIQSNLKFAQITKGLEDYPLESQIM